MDDHEFGTYLRQLRQTPLLTPQEEWMIVQRLELRRQRLRFRLLSSPYVLHGAMTLAEGVATGEMRFDRVIEADVRDLRRKHQLIECISPLLRRIRQLHDSSVRAYIDWLHRQNYDSLRRHFRQWRELIHLIEQLEIRLEQLEVLWLQRRQAFSQETTNSCHVAKSCCCLSLETQHRFQRWDRRAVRSASAYVQAKNALVTPNLRLVVSVAKRYRLKGKDMLDLVQEGNLGLMRAADKFKSSFRGRFSTYAVWWIRKAVLKTIDQDRLVRSSFEVRMRARDIESCRQMLSHQLRRDPTLAEISAAMQLDERTVEKTAMMNGPPLNFELDIGSERTTSEAIYHKHAPSEHVNLNLMRHHLGQVMTSLDVRECKVLKLRYGWDGRGKRTLLEISKSLGLSRSRVGQIEQEALKKLRQRWKHWSEPLVD